MFECKIVMHLYQIKQFERNNGNAWTMFDVTAFDSTRHGIHGLSKSLQGALGCLGCRIRRGTTTTATTASWHKHGFNLRQAKFLNWQTSIFILNVPPTKQRSLHTSDLLVFNANSPMEPIGANVI
jgi:hypothetical protein